MSFATSYCTICLVARFAVVRQLKSWIYRCLRDVSNFKKSNKKYFYIISFIIFVEYTYMYIQVSAANSQSHWNDGEKKTRNNFYLPLLIFKARFFLFKCVPHTGSRHYRAYIGIGVSFDDAWPSWFRLFFVCIVDINTEEIKKHIAVSCLKATFLMKGTWNIFFFHLLA